MLDDGHNGKSGAGGGMESMRLDLLFVLVTVVFLGFFFQNRIISVDITTNQMTFENS